MATAFDVRVVEVPPGGERPCPAGEWDDALLVVDRGEIELDCAGGSRRRFGRGAVLGFRGLPVRALRNPGPEPAVLVAVSRR
jgi:Cupin domain